MTPAAPTANHGLPAGRADEHVHGDNRDQTEDHAADAPPPWVIAEQLDPAGHDQLRELGMLGVRVLMQRRIGVGRTRRRVNPRDHSGRIDVVGLVKNERVVRAGPAWRAARAADEQHPGQERHRQDDEQRDERRARVREQLSDPSHHAMHAVHVRNVLGRAAAGTVSRC